MGILAGEAAEGGAWQPPTIHHWLKPKVSGNAINGLGEAEKRRPTVIYHAPRRHPWLAVQVSFILRTMKPFSVFKAAGKVFDLDKREPIPIAKERPEHTAQEWTSRIKAEAKALGYDQVGITRVTPDLLFEGYEVSQPFAVILAKRLDPEKFDEALLRRRDWVTGGIAVLDTYYFGNFHARLLADWLRERGWNATGFGSMNVSALNLVHAAIRAGIGELGKHGSLISKELGSAFRLSYVFTDTPLIEDAPVDIGAFDFCSNCKLCSTECPPRAIYDEPQLVRGERKWYVDFDKCVPFFNETNGCALCLAVCPWSRPGVAPKLSAKMLARRTKQKG